MPSPTVQVLRDARERIADPSRWTTRVNARDAQGASCSPLSREACQWCCWGALDVAADRFEGYYAAERYLIAAAGRSRLSVNVTRVNDDGGHASALKLYDDAISLAISAEEAKAHG